jgi:thiamine pyrophosphokinase
MPAEECRFKYKNPPAAQRRDFILRAVVFANGELNDLEAAKALIKQDDVLIAADGGARYCLAMGLLADSVIGDFDSLNEEELAILEEQGAEIIRHDHRKDETDLELALLHALHIGVEEALILGGLGRRWDQTLANLLLPAYHRLRGLQIIYWDDGEWLYLIEEGRQIAGTAGMKVSLIPLGGDALGVRTEGLEWQLKDETLHFGASRGISNLMLGDTARVRLRQGVLLCVVGSKE